MRLRLGVVMVFGVTAVLLAGCGGGSASTTASTTPKDAEPATTTACVKAWDDQPMGLPKEAALLAVGEGDYEAWVAIYAGPPVHREAGTFAATFSGHHCLVAIPGAGGYVYAYQEGEWTPQGEGSGPLYRYATDPASGSQAEIIGNVHLELVSDEKAGSEADLTRCLNLWNGSENAKPRSEIGSLEPTTINVTISEKFPDHCLVTVTNSRIGLAAQFLQAEDGQPYAYEVIYSGEATNVPPRLMRSNGSLNPGGLLSLGE